MAENQKKIVLADDEQFIARAYSQGLTKAGYEVHTANDGTTGLEMIKETKPDLILLDLIMPGMTGFEILKAVKSDPVLKDIPVMILSNLSQETDQEEAIKLGATKFLIKSDVSLANVIDNVNEFFKK